MGQHIQVCNPGLTLENLTMTTARKPMSARGQNPSDLDTYNKASKTAAVGRNMRTFSRTKRNMLISSWNDVHGFTVLGNSFKWLGDVSGGVDAATVISAQAESILDVIWETYYTNANLKDRVDAEEAAWKLYFATAMQINIALQLQYNYRCYLPAYTEADAVPGSTTNISYFSQSSYDIFVASMKDYPIPKGVYEIVDLFCTWVVRLTESYERYTLRIPAAILCPFETLFDLEDLQAMRTLLRVNLGNFTTHAKKFGLKVGAFRDPVKPTEKICDDPDVIAFFNHAYWYVYDDGTVTDQVCKPNGGFGGGNITTDWTLHEYMFKDEPNESLIHVLAPWFGIYDATNNKYGGVIISDMGAVAEYYINMKTVAFHGDNVAEVDLGMGVIADTVIGLFKATYDNRTAAVSTSITGTNLTADKGMDDSWPLATFNRLYMGTGRGIVEAQDDLINFLGRLL